MKDTEEESGEMGNIYISSEQIIQEVQKFRCLYDTADPDHKDRDVVKDAWLSVTQAVVGEPWAKLNDAEKSEAVRQMKTKWKNLKGSFVRSLKKEGDPRKSVHGRELSFILETDHYKKFVNSKMDTASRTLVLNEEEFIRNRPRLCKMNLRTLQDDHTFELGDSSTSFHSSFSMPQETRNTETENPDRMFLLSLLPKVSALNSRDKMDFQIGIMQLLQGYESE